MISSPFNPEPRLLRFSGANRVSMIHAITLGLKRRGSQWAVQERNRRATAASPTQIRVKAQARRLRSHHYYRVGPFCLADMLTCFSTAVIWATSQAKPNVKHIFFFFYHVRWREFRMSGWQIAARLPVPELQIGTWPSKRPGLGNGWELNMIHTQTHSVWACVYSKCLWLDAFVYKKPTCAFNKPYLRY